MTARLPDYFALERYAISAADVVRLAFRCDPSQIHANVLMTPIWSHEVFLDVATLREVVTPERVVTLHYHGSPFVAQFHHLDEMVNSHGCIGIEMETAAVFRAARLVGIPAAALLQISDVAPDSKSLRLDLSAEPHHLNRYESIGLSRLDQHYPAEMLMTVVSLIYKGVLANDGLASWV